MKDALEVIMNLLYHIIKSALSLTEKTLKEFYWVQIILEQNQKQLYNGGIEWSDVKWIL